MRKIVLFIAMSLDGYIADRDGKVDWLAGQDSSADDGDGYAAFIQNVDTVVMGYNTYRQITTELSPNEWVYEGLTSYVITHRELASTENIIFTAKSPCEVVKELRERPGKRIWICGGADIVGQLIKANLIDEYRISIIPAILGGGIRLFGTANYEIKLKLADVHSCNGITELTYMRRQ